jgi:hypothetical protein
MNLKLDNLQLVILKAYEELHTGDAVRLYYGKAKRVNIDNKDEQPLALGIVLPLLNPPVIKRNRQVKVAVYGTFFLPKKEVKPE